jgi:GT2 family glycosyltransferase
MTVLRWLAEGDVPSVLAEHSDEPDPHLVVPGSCVRVHVEADGRAFSKAAACNAGYARAGAEVLALVDADMLMPMEPFRATADVAHREWDAIRPFGRLVDLDEEQTRAVAAGAPLPPTPDGHRDDHRNGEHIPLCGGLVIMRSAAYESVGGMDPVFEGWGGEDDALSAALVRRGLRCGILRTPTAFHLAHPRSVESRYRHPHYARNRSRAIWWHESSDVEVEGAMREGRERLQRA